jgi:hypothetical protein
MVDESRWPVVTIRFPPDPDDAALRVAIERMGAIFGRNQAVLVVIDVRLNLTGLTSARRALVRDLMASIQKDADRLMIGAIYVAPSPLAAGVITALNWSRGKRPYPVHTVRSTEQAESVLQTLLAEHARAPRSM